LQRVKGSKREKRAGVWELRVFQGHDPLTGSPRYLSRTVHGGVRDADRELAKLVTSVGGVVDARITVGDLLDKWLEHIESLGRSPSTMRGYRSGIERAIRPALGRHRLDKLTPRDLDAFYRAFSESGRAPRTVLGVHRILHTALEQAVRWGLVDRNVADRATPPSIPMSEVATPTPDELARLVDTASTGRNPDRAPFLLFAALTGARRGELCGLKWGDVELATGQVTIRRSLLDVDGVLIERQPKTGRVRRIALGELGGRILAERRRLVDERAAAVGCRITDAAYLWSDVEDGLDPLRPGTATEYFARLAVQCDMVGPNRKSPRYSLHSLRHFAATQLVGANVDVRTVSGRTGHADATTLLRIYAHALEERDVEAANVLGRIIGGPVAGQFDPDTAGLCDREATERQHLFVGAAEVIDEEADRHDPPRRAGASARQSRKETGRRVPFHRCD
jgi:integrase